MLTSIMALNSKLMFKTTLTEEDICKILHIDSAGLMTLLHKGEFCRYKSHGGYFFIFKEIKDYLKRKENGYKFM